jgi:hypothetical protein
MTLESDFLFQIKSAGDRESPNEKNENWYGRARRAERKHENKLDIGYPLLRGGLCYDTCFLSAH